MHEPAHLKIEKWTQLYWKGRGSERATDALLYVCHYANFGVALMCNMEPLFFIIPLIKCMSGIKCLLL